MNQETAPDGKSPRFKPLIMRSPLLAVGIIMAVVAVFAALAATAYKDHNWALGLAPQRTAKEIESVKQAVQSASPKGALDIYVANSNTSGTPFGHSISISVLLSQDDTDTQQKAVDAIGEAIIRSVQQNGLKDSYRLLIGYNIEKSVISGSGSAQQPITEARDIGFPDFDQKFTIN